METTVKQRLKQYICYKGISVRKFELTIGVTPSYVQNMRVSIQPDKISSIAHHYPDLNTGWLLTGKGTMLQHTEDETPSITNVTLIDNDFYINIINEQSKLIKFLEDKIEKLEADKNQQMDYGVAAAPE